MTLESLFHFLSITGIVMFLLATGFGIKSLYSWFALKVFSTKYSLKNFLTILSETVQKVNQSNNVFATIPENKVDEETSTEKLNDHIKKGNSLYQALKEYTKGHTFGGSDALAYHLRYKVSRANSESYLNQLKALAIEADRCSELIKENISTVIKEVNAKSVSPEFDKPTSNPNQHKSTNSNKGSSSSQSTNNTNIPKCSIDPNTLNNNGYYTFIGFDSKNNQKKRWKNVKGSELRSLIEDVLSGNYPQDGIYPMYLETNTSTTTTSTTPTPYTPYTPYTFTK